jgi:hypothetical protein
MDALYLEFYLEYGCTPPDYLAQDILYPEFHLEYRCTLPGIFMQHTWK